MKYKVILWDADGVLIKSARLFSEQLSLDYGISLEKMTPFFTGVFSECTRGNADLKEELARVIDDWGWKGTVDELMQYWFTVGTQIDEDVADVIRRASAEGARCFMATDNEKYRGEHLRTTLGGGRLFEEVFYAAAIGAVKKEPAFFEHIFRALPDVSPSEMLFIDDGEKNVEVAKSLGINAYLYTDLARLKEFLAYV